MTSNNLADIGLLLFLILLAVGLWVLTLQAWPAPMVDREAVARARALLREVLAEAEWQQLQQTGWLELESPTRPGARYRIPARPGPVELVEPTGERRLLCLVPLAPLPVPELVLLHKLWIEADEAEYLRRANRLPAPVGRDLEALGHDTWRWWWGE